MGWRLANVATPRRFGVVELPRIRRIVLQDGPVDAVVTEETITAYHRPDCSAARVRAELAWYHRVATHQRDEYCHQR